MANVHKRPNCLMHQALSIDHIEKICRRVSSNICLWFYLPLLDFVLRQVMLYVLFIYSCSSGNIASDYVELLLLSLEIVRRVRVHKHGSIDK
jgi:hypothetical protein